MDYTLIQDSSLTFVSISYNQDTRCVCQPSWTLCAVLEGTIKETKHMRKEVWESSRVQFKGKLNQFAKGDRTNAKAYRDFNVPNQLCKDRKSLQRRGKDRFSREKTIAPNHSRSLKPEGVNLMLAMTITQVWSPLPFRLKFATNHMIVFCPRKEEPVSLRLRFSVDPFLL